MLIGTCCLAFLLFLSNANALPENAEDILKDKINNLEKENIRLKKELETILGHRDVFILLTFLFCFISKKIINP
jgi:hypothetical protein